MKKISSEIEKLGKLRTIVSNSVWKIESDYSEALRLLIIWNTLNQNKILHKELSYKKGNSTISLIRVTILKQLIICLHRILDSKSRKGDKASLIEIAVILRDNPQVFNWFCEDTQTWPVAKKENIRKCKNFFNKFISQLALDSENKSATLMFQKINNYRDRIVAHNITDENLTKNINLAYNDLFKFIGEIGKVIVNLNLYVSGTSTGDGYKTYVKNAKNDAEAFCNILIKGLT